MAKSYSLGNLTIFSILIYLILVLTNNYYSIEEAFVIGFTDIKQYLKIIESSPSVPIENVTTQQGYRFFIPYTVGALSYFTKVNDYYLFIFFLFVTHLFILNLFNQLVIQIGCKKNFSLIFISSLIFNAYFFRPSLITPYIINDWIFVYGLMLIATYVLKKKEYYFDTGLILCAITRQTSLILNILFFLLIILNFSFKQKINIKIYLYGILINTLIFIILTFLSSIFFSDLNSKMYFNLLLGIFNFNYSFLELVTFIIRLINTHLFSIILLFFFILNFNSHKKILNFEMLFLAFLSIIIFVQPILGGPSVTGGNISRLTVISMPIILVFFLFIFKDKEINSTNTIIVVLLLFLSSLHHNYTYLLNYFFDYKNFHFALINFSLHLIIFIILFKNNNQLNKVR